jgi:hypothetical protein
MSLGKLNYKQIADEQREMVMWLIEKDAENLRFYKTLIPLWILFGVIIGVSILRLALTLM